MLRCILPNKFEEKYQYKTIKLYNKLNNLSCNNLNERFSSKHERNHNQKFRTRNIGFNKNLN